LFINNLTKVLSSIAKAIKAITSETNESIAIQIKKEIKNNNIAEIPNRGKTHKNKKIINQQNIHTTKILIRFLKYV
jgi:hypothetical protein